jgi:hypothetical protein
MAALNPVSGGSTPLKVRPSVVSSLTLSLNPVGRAERARLAGAGVPGGAGSRGGQSLLQQPGRGLARSRERDGPGRRGHRPLHRANGTRGGRELRGDPCHREASRSGCGWSCSPEQIDRSHSGPGELLRRRRGREGEQGRHLVLPRSEAGGGRPTSRTIAFWRGVTIER